MSAAAGTTAVKGKNLVGKEFEETFKPKGGVSDKLLEQKKGKRKKSGFIKALIALVIVIVLIGGAGAALYFSGNLQPVFDAVGITLPSTGPSIAQQQAALDQREAQLNAYEESLIELKEELDDRQAALDAAETSQVTEATFEDIRAGFSEEKLTELKQLGAIYTKMDPDAAAAIMMEIYDAEQLAVIIFYMQPGAAALVLEKMDPGLAADVTRIITD